eukprot:3284976-Lingulodinium_polyedra.AAC.1
MEELVRVRSLLGPGPGRLQEPARQGRPPAAGRLEAGLQEQLADERDELRDGGSPSAGIEG